MVPVRLFAEPPDATAAPPEDLESRSVVRAALARVPRRQQAVLILRFFHDLPAGDRYGIAWRDGKASTFDIPGNDRSISSINATGLGVGDSYADDGTISAWLYRDGTITRLPGGERATAVSINAHNAIAGAVQIGDPVPGQRYSVPGTVPAVWRTPDAEPERLALPSEAITGHATAVDDDGTVVGSIIVPGSVPAAYVWSPDGTGRRLPLPPAPPGGWPAPDPSAALPVGTDPGTLYSIVSWLRDGWAVGRVGTFNHMLPVRWDLRTGTAQLLIDAGTYRLAVGNPAGWFPATDADSRPVLLVPGHPPIQLPLLFAHGKGIQDHLPIAVSDDGRLIAGQANASDGVIKPVVWRCS